MARNNSKRYSVRIKYEVVSDNYDVVKTFDSYQKSSADDFASMLNDAFDSGKEAGEEYAIKRMKEVRDEVTA